MNGATQTFRRPSIAPSTSHGRDGGQPSSTTPSTPTSGTALNPQRNDSRYSKDQLLDIYKALRDSGILGKNLADYFVADWDPHLASPTTNGGAWGKRDDHRNNHSSSTHHKDNHVGPEICWDHGGQVEPLGLLVMPDDEKEVCLLLLLLLFLMLIVYSSSPCR